MSDEQKCAMCGGPMVESHSPSGFLSRHWVDGDACREAAEGGKGESMSNEQAQRIRWDEQFKTYRLEDEQGNVVLNFTSPQAGAEHHYAMWRKVERLRATVERYRAHLQRMQADATTYLMPDRPDCDRAWFISRILWHLDGPQERAIEALAASGPAQEGETAKGAGHE